MALDQNASSREQMKKKKKAQPEPEEDDEIDEMNTDNAVAVVDATATSSSRDGLLCTLLKLRARSPSPSSSSLFVLRKKLVKSYLSRNQNYLGITQAEYERGFYNKRKGGGGGVLTGDEHAAAAGGGLPLLALDRRGGRYQMVLVRLRKTCRLRTGWGEFLRGSGVRHGDDGHVGDVVEIWAFRSPAWPTGLGLVLLHYTKEEDAEIRASLLEQEEEKEVEEVDKDKVVRAAGILVSMKSK